MLCLYCDRPLALLKRLTGDGEFCSKEHRRIYQKEHNQLALARLLDAQPNNNNKKAKRPGIQQNRDNPAPAAPLPVEKREERRQPERAGFISEFLREASAVSVAHRSSAGPRFQNITPVLAEPVSAQSPEPGSQPRSLPKTANFLSESPLLSFAREVRFPSQVTRMEPFAGRPRLEESHTHETGIPMRRQPGRAGFISGQPLAPVSATPSASTKGRRAPGPRFSPLVPVKLLPEKAGAGTSRSRSAPKLPLAAHIPPSTDGARSIPDSIRRLAAEPHWKPLAAALPKRTMGRITLVLGSFLRRPVRIASQDGVPESFEIRFRPVSFPPYSPRMGMLEERSLGTDRIGITPP
jgi:hypothetical protein